MLQDRKNGEMAQRTMVQRHNPPSIKLCRSTRGNSFQEIVGNRAVEISRSSGLVILIFSRLPSIRFIFSPVF